ncbi:hypothetical protein Poli38472_010594 [Pythium oligandrum]|uniref:Uncharacterized protein n=1 Tax=Pythium oligandrum TaxID=41045 RepID=A0A8K1FDL4_PYTOL|nr:hypothetical protein Poli38472_010594 [Pythium oligandrum]|eukprot:TMW55712.1 hypothetical protein Poli38472_010594 [Pythium oligandrum]
MRSSVPTGETAMEYAALQTPRGGGASVATSFVDEDPWTSDLRNPLDNAGWLSKITLWWLNPLMARGYKRPLEEEDVWNLPQADQAAVLQEIFDKHFEEIKAKHNDPSSPPRIHLAIWKSTQDMMIGALLLLIASAAAVMLQPMFIKALLEYLQGSENMFGITSGYALAALLTVASFVGVNTVDYSMYLSARAGICARTIIINSVYRKILKLTSTARQSMNSGDIITLAGVDSERLYEAYTLGLWAIVSPLMVVTCCILIGVELGVYSGLAAAVCSGVIMTYAIRNARKIGLLRRDILKVAGERVKVTNEVLQGIRVIKMYAWEQSMNERVREIREEEIRLIRRYDYLRVRNMVMLTLANVMMTMACFIVFIYQGNSMTVPTTFTILSLANTSRQPFNIFSNAIVFSTEAFASLDRISKFLGADEVELLNGASQAHLLQKGEGIIEISDADFTWGAESNESVPRPILQNINLSLQPGSLTIVVGAVGSGKSSLVSAMLGEMHRLRGTSAVRGSIAYASQQAWIQHNSVRENILFGKPFDQQHYDAVISACQMRRDLDILENGDATEIGERGINLSGGQKARVSLARVMYRRESDVVVMDDPLSALDVHVANAVFFDCVLGLVKSKTRVLVLNAHYHLLPHAGRILVMQEGRIVGDGSFDDMKARFSFLEDHALEKAALADGGAGLPNKSNFSLDDSLSGENEADIENKELVRDALTYSDTQATVADEMDIADRLSMSSVTPRSSRLSRRSRMVSSRIEEEKPAAKSKEPKSMMLEEDRVLGSITWQTYTGFFALTGWNGTLVAISIMSAFMVGQGGLLAGDYFVKFWSEGSIDLSQKTLLWIYVGIIVVAIFLAIFRSLFFTEVCIQSAKEMHTRYFRKVLMAPISTFFDVTPIGRVLNRFSRDLDQIDAPLPYYSLAFLTYITLVMSVFVVCAITTPTTAILYIPLLGMCYWIQRYFLASSRELKRLDGITRSPFLNLVGETINGIESIRSFRMTDSFAEKCRELLDYNSKFFFLYQTSTKWLAVRLDWLVTSVVLVVSFTCVGSRDSMGVGNAGIALTYAVQLALQVQRLLTLGSMTENYMTSFERIAYYSSLDEEGDSREVITTPEPAWPQQGRIEFNNVFLRYRDGLEFVLRGVSFTVQPGHKVGVCGRTGSGKSTLMNALFRTVELAQGSVRIDGVDIASISLHALRSKLTIIPQDPVLFSGTLRDNLDPFNDKTDEELFGVLRKVHLMDDVSKWGAGLSHQVTEKGDNLSVGQRQLICIARALLRDSRIIVLDEATANVDQELDRLIQVAVKENFVGRTSLTIAHRLETIADSDRILVMDHGVVAEYDSPANLLKKPNGIFASLMESTKSS